MFLRVFSCRFLVSSSLFVIKIAVFFLLKKEKCFCLDGGIFAIGRGTAIRLLL
jgi:hypothetical protein